MKPDDELQLLYSHVCAMERELESLATQGHRTVENHCYLALFAQTPQERCQAREDAFLYKGKEDGIRLAKRYVADQIQFYKTARNRADVEAEKKRKPK